MNTLATTTPNVSLQDLERPDRLSYQKRIDDMAQVLCWFEANDPQQELGAAEVVAVGAVQKEIRSRLEYRSGGMPWESQEVGSCYSFAWHTSLALDELGIKHFIGFTHGHAYCVAIDASGNAHMINTDQPALNDFDLTNSQFSGTLVSDMAKGDLDGRSRVVVMSTERLQAKATADAWYRRKAKKPPVTYPWTEDGLPATTIMSPEIGRRGLYVYKMFTRELSTLKDVDPAAMSAILRELKECNPQQETRPKHNDDMKEFNNYVKRMIHAGQSATSIARIIDQYCACMPDTRSMKIFRGDALRLIAERTPDSSVAVSYAEQAAHSYISSAQTVRLDPMRLGKIRRCKEIVNRHSTRTRNNKAA